MDDAARIAGGAVVLVNVLTPRPGRTEEFVAARTAECVRLRGLVPRAVGNRLPRGLDGAKVVNIATFGSALSKEHLGRLRPLVDSVEPGLFEQVHVSD